MSYTVVDIGLGSAYDFFFEIASPNHREFARNPSSRLAALNAAWPLWHMCEWYVWDHHPREAEVRRTRDAYIDQNLLPECRELGWLRDIAEAGKHFKLGRDSATITVRALSSREEYNACFGDAPFATVPFGSGSGLEFLVYVAGDSHPLMRVTGAACRYWLGKVLPHHIEIPLAPDEMPERSEEMLKWCRDHLGDETARKPRWTLLQGANQPHYVQRLAFLEAEDEQQFKRHFQV